MLTDRQGNTLPGATPDTAALYDQAVEAFNTYTGDPITLLDQAIDAAPGCAMALIVKAHLYAVATEPGANAEARALVDRARALPLGEREASHVTALDALLAGDWSRAARLLDSHNARFPHDLVALQSGHLIDFYRASARGLRDRIARVLPAWSPAMPGYGYVLGMHAFGLEECGDYARAEEAGRRAIDIDPADCWAHHAVTHVMEMQGRAEDGVGWMLVRQPHWAQADNFFKVHNWWHLALFRLDLGQTREALALYDDAVRAEPSVVALDMVDASALLWRLHLLGEDVGPRWQELAERWTRHADGRTYPFNDLHAVMAWLGAGRDADVERLRVALAGATGDTEVGGWARRTGRPLVEGFTAFWRGDYARAVEELHAARYIANAFGGSHAQRDIIDWTLTEAALRAGRPDLAMALAHERLDLKPHSAVNRGFLRRAGQAAAVTERVA